MCGRQLNEAVVWLCSSKFNYISITFFTGRKMVQQYRQKNWQKKHSISIDFFLYGSMDPSPFVRTSFWTMSLGLSVGWTAGTGIGQSTVQRFLSLPNLSDAQKYGFSFISLLKFRLFIFISSILILLQSILSLEIYLVLHHRFVYYQIFCHLPGTVHLWHVWALWSNHRGWNHSIGSGIKTFGTKKSPDNRHSQTESVWKFHLQIVPLFVIQVGQKLPGISGLFIAGIFAASLATMSGIWWFFFFLKKEDFVVVFLVCKAAEWWHHHIFLLGQLNTLSGTIYMDFVRPWCVNQFLNTNFQRTILLKFSSPLRSNAQFIKANGKAGEQ